MKLTHFAVTGLVLLLVAAVYLMMQTDMDGRMAEMKADYDRKLELMEKARKESAPTPPALASAADAAAAKINEGAAAVKTAASKVAGKVNKQLPDDPAVGEALENVKATLKSRANELATNGEETPGAVPAEPGDSGDLPPELLAKEQREILTNTGVDVERIGLEDAVIAGAAPAGKKLTNVQSLVLNQPSIARVKPNPNSKIEQVDFVVLDKGSDVGLKTGDSLAVRRGTAIIGRVVIGDTVERDQCIANIVPEKLVTGMVLEAGDEIIKFDR